MSDAQEEKAGQVAVQTTETSDFASLLNKEFKPQSTRAREEVESAVATLAQQALGTAATISSDVVASIQAIVAELDKKLSAQVNEIMHNPDFQSLEFLAHDASAKSAAAGRASACPPCATRTG